MKEQIKLILNILQALAFLNIVTFRLMYDDGALSQFETNVPDRSSPLFFLLFHKIKNLKVLTDC